ncbi:MAG: hypothetical protein K2Z25_18060 [Beijerinckiaceae bacterium]|nr:hypothetical protein [Beijerinckiaceae bacterium]
MRVADVHGHAVWLRAAQNADLRAGTKIKPVVATLVPGAVASAVAGRHGLSTGTIRSGVTQPMVEYC